jgi:hypothetical protein
VEGMQSFLSTFHILFVLNFQNILRGALDGLYAEFRKLSTEKFIRGEFRRRITITTSWNIVVLLLSIVTPNITIAIELLG